MIKCFKEIKNLGAYENFIWTQSFSENTKKDGVINHYFFEKVNIIYGQNYAGKTTLSRLVMGLKNGYLSNRYINPMFNIQLRDDSVIDQSNFLLQSSDIRVFNEDFILHNLSFLYNENSKIKSFVVLGERNNEIELEISKLRAELGDRSEDDDLNTGLYAQAIFAKKENDTERRLLKDLHQEKDKIFMDKSTRSADSIKNKHHYFGNNTLNYTKTRLEHDINHTDASSLLDPSEIEKLRVFIDEEEKEIVTLLPTFSTRLAECQRKAKELLSKELSVSQSIKELIDNNYLNQWVRDGKALHEQEGKCKCLFCGNDIDDSLWGKLDQHYNKQSENLLFELNSLDKFIANEKEKLERNLSFEFDDKKLYSEFRSDIKTIQDEINKVLKKSYEISKEIQGSVKKRIESPNQVLSIEEVDLTFFSDVNAQISELNALIDSSNKKTIDIDSEKNNARNKLFKHELISFKNHINYDSMIININQASDVVKEKRDSHEAILAKIRGKNIEIKELEEGRIDESRGAEEINKILCDNLGHPNLKLKAISGSDGYHYVVMRDEQLAYNLSEGEKSLIAFCYFIADLENINADKSNRLIWIDDPISSLDSGHIFYIYSIIRDRITSKKDSFKQFFISTHSLDFLKLSKRLYSKEPNYYIVDKSEKYSSIKKMPNYLKLYSSEFNYIFENIYRCASEEQNDENFHIFFNFGNNCRKFIEIYLAFKYPDGLKSVELKMKNLFGDSLSVFFTDRVNNEYSHLAGSFERGLTPVYQEEVSKTAKLVLDVIKREDSRQFQSLIDSITINK